MKRWNGWGNINTDYPVPPSALDYLTKRLGQLNPLPDAVLAPNGGIDLLSQIRCAVQADLGWDDLRWNAEASLYASLWRDAYSGGQSVELAF